MNNSTLNTLLKDYEQKRYIADLKFEKAKSDFYDSHPELADLNSKLAKIALDISKAVLKKDLNLANSLRLEFNALKSKKETLLNSIDIPKRCFKPFI